MAVSVFYPFHLWLFVGIEYRAENKLEWWSTEKTFPYNDWQLLYFTHMGCFHCSWMCAAESAHHSAAVPLGLRAGLLQDGATVSAVFTGRGGKSQPVGEGVRKQCPRRWGILEQLWILLSLTRAHIPKYPWRITAARALHSSPEEREETS